MPHDGRPRVRAPAGAARGGRILPRGHPRIHQAGAPLVACASEGGPPPSGSASADCMDGCRERARTQQAALGHLCGKPQTSLP